MEIGEQNNKKFCQYCKRKIKPNQLNEQNKREK